MITSYSSIILCIVNTPVHMCACDTEQVLPYNIARYGATVRYQLHTEEVSNMEYHHATVTEIDRIGTLLEASFSVAVH
jgi:hypothetical protein